MRAQPIPQEIIPASTKWLSDPDGTTSGPPLSPSQESFPPCAHPAHRNIPGIDSWYPASRNMRSHSWFVIIGTWTSFSLVGIGPPWSYRDEIKHSCSHKNEIPLKIQYVTGSNRFATCIIRYSIRFNKYWTWILFLVYWNLHRCVPIQSPNQFCRQSLPPLPECK